MSFPEKIINFIKEVRLEAKKVNWPTRQEVVQYTIIVFGVSFAIAAYLGGLDLIFSAAINKLLLR